MGAETLTAACELAFAVARQGREAVPPIESPAAMRSFLWVAQLPPRAISVAQRVISSDPEFRSRVAAQATESQVGRAGYLWLTRPGGWDAEFASLTGGSSGAESIVVPPPAAPAPIPTPPIPTPPMSAPAPPAVVAPIPQAPVGPPVEMSQTPDRETSKSAIDEELASLRGLVDRLADERKMVDESSNVLENDVEERRAESSTLATQIDVFGRDLATARSERDAALAEKEAALMAQADAATRISVLEDERASFEHERSLVQSSLASAEKSMSTTRAQLDKLTAENAELASQLETVTAERDEALSEAGSLRTERDELTDRVTSAEQARADLDSEMSELSSQWRTVQAELQDITEQRVQVEAELDRLSMARVVSVHDNAALFNRLAEQLGRLDAERNLLAGQLEKAHARLSGTRSALEQATRSLESECGAVEEAFGDLNEITKNLGVNLDQLGETGRDVEALVADAADMAAESAAAVAAFDGPESVEATPADLPPMPPPPGDVPTIPAPPSFGADQFATGNIPPMPVPPMPEPPMPDFPVFEVEPAAATIPPMPAPPAQVTSARAQVQISPEAQSDPSAAAREVVQTIDIVVLVDGDAVAEMGWPTLTLVDRRGAIVEYLEGLAASTGAAADVVFDGNIGGEDSLPSSLGVRVRLTAAQITPVVALAELIDDYPVEWPVAVVSDEGFLASEAASRGAIQLSNSQLLDLFIAQ